jgi:hypothetical protein
MFCSYLTLIFELASFKKTNVDFTFSWLENAKRLCLYSYLHSKADCIDQLRLDAVDWIKSVEKLQYEQKTPLRKIEDLIVSGEALPFDVSKGKDEIIFIIAIFLAVHFAIPELCILREKKAYAKTWLESLKKTLMRPIERGRALRRQLSGDVDVEDAGNLIESKHKLNINEMKRVLEIDEYPSS